MPDREAPLVIGLPDLVVQTTSNPPASIRRGQKFSITNTVLNQGEGSTTSSKVRYYLTLDGHQPGPLLSGTRSVPALASGQTSQGTTSVGVPASAESRPYRVLVCADDYRTVGESNEGNNCLASQGSVTVLP